MTARQAVILAAGEGTRMRPLTYTRPKVMLPIANRPILEHLVMEMKEAGVDDFIFIVGYQEEKIRDYFADGQKWQIRIRYCRQKTQSGTADAVRMAEGLFEGDFLVANGDVIVRRDNILRLLAKNQNAMTVVELPEVTGLGVIEGSGGLVTKIHEKMANPPTHLANAGLYLFTPEVFAAIRSTAKSPRGEFEITDSIQNIIGAGLKVAYLEIEEWFDLSYPWDLLSANEKLLGPLVGQNRGQIEPNVSLKGAVSIGRNTIIRSGAYIVGPVMIGDNCDIGPNCFIRPSTAIGDNCHVGAAVEVKNSIVMSQSKIPHLNYVGDSVIGENCNLGAGTKIANLRLDKQNISIGNIETKRRKLGAILGDQVETGINANINVGTMIGNNSFIGPGALAHGVIPPSARVLLRM
jgi:UDP-N-acetylglucosamine diphosphorylase/glucosamine-1-phosphate N-acetyltransferase